MITAALWAAAILKISPVFIVPAMNFFSDTPDNALFDERAKDQELLHKYSRIKEHDRQFGDLLLLMANKEALHMCVYLADDVVFTKNGANTIQPWVLMRVPDMLANYEADKPFQVLTYRRKSPPLSSALEYPVMARAR